MGDHFSSLSKHLVGRHLNLNMKFFSIICFVGFSQAFVVRREAEAEADADAFGIGYGASPRAVSAPVCKSVPQKVCKDRTIETPRKVCHTEHDEIVDTTITEHCQTTTTTKCEQTSSQTRHSSNIVGSDSKVFHWNNCFSRGDCCTRSFHSWRCCLRLQYRYFRSCCWLWSWRSNYLNWSCWNYWNYWFYWCCEFWSFSWLWWCHLWKERSIC